MTVLRATSVAVLALVSFLTASCGAFGQHGPLKVAILIFNGVEIIDYTGPYEVFGGEGYDVFTVAATTAPISTTYGMRVTPRYSFANAPQADIVLIPGGGVSDSMNDPDTLRWIRAETVKASHTMSVCNGAYILANTGLLDGLKATTTYRLIPRLRALHPKITVVEDQRFVDNGKILTAAGLSSGIDGALHLVEVMDGAAAAQQNALGIEYDWKSRGGFVRAALADRLVPDADLARVGPAVLERTEGDRDHWEIEQRVTSTMPLAAISDAVRKAYATAYESRSPGVRFTVVDATTSSVQLHDADGHSWQGTLSIANAAGESGRYKVTYRVRRVG